MSCKVRLYDGKFADLCNNSIQIAAIDQGPPPVNCCPVQPNRSVHSPNGQVACGADLAFRQRKFVYQVAIHDPTGAVAGTTLPDLSGNRPGDLDVVLYSAPPPGSHRGQITAPASFAQVSSFIEEQTHWTVKNKIAVKSVVRGIISLLQLFASLMSIDEVMQSVESEEAVFIFTKWYAHFLDGRGIEMLMHQEKDFLRHGSVRDNYCLPKHDFGTELHKANKVTTHAAP